MWHTLTRLLPTLIGHLTIPDFPREQLEKHLGRWNVCTSVPLVLDVSSHVKNPLLPTSGRAHCCGWVSKAQFAKKSIKPIRFVVREPVLKLHVCAAEQTLADLSLEWLFL